MDKLAPMSFLDGNYVLGNLGIYFFIIGNLSIIGASILSVFSTKQRIEMSGASRFVIDNSVGYSNARKVILRFHLIRWGIMSIALPILFLIFWITPELMVAQSSVHGTWVSTRHYSISNYYICASIMMIPMVLVNLAILIEKTIIEWKQAQKEYTGRGGETDVVEVVEIEEELDVGGDEITNGDGATEKETDVLPPYVHKLGSKKK